MALCLSTDRLAVSRLVEALNKYQLLKCSFFYIQFSADHRLGRRCDVVTRTPVDSETIYVVVCCMFMHQYICAAVCVARVFSYDGIDVGYPLLLYLGIFISDSAGFW